MKKNILRILVFVFLIIGNIMINSCSSTQPNDVSPPSSIDRNNASSLGVLGGWMSSEDLFFIWSPQSEPKVLALNLVTGAVSEIQTPEIGWFPFVTVAQNGTVAGYTGYSELIIYDLSKRQIIQEVDGTSIAFSPEGDQFAVWHQGKLLVGHIGDSDLEILYEINEISYQKEGKRPSKTEWRPKFQQIAFILKGHDPNNQANEGADTILLVDIATKKAISLISKNGWIDDFSWSPNGEFISYATSSNSTDKGKLTIYDIQNNCEIGNIETEWPPIALWSPDGGKIVHHVSSSLDILGVKEFFGYSYEDLTCKDQ